ncbi:MAG TPA: hypothetical protein VN328_12315 [Thermodesulfovibrionales bacterium]|nr:hypothetical protein [Thermodesulfovibrionales bacterium]
MKPLRILLLSLLAVGLTLSGAFAMKHLPEERGKTLFNDPKFGGGKSGKSCATCHKPEMKDEKMSLRSAGGKTKSIEETVNICIEGPLMGKAIDPGSEQMKDIVAYIRSLGKMKK